MGTAIATTVLASDSGSGNQAYSFAMIALAALTLVVLRLACSFQPIPSSRVSGQANSPAPVALDAAAKRV